MTASSPGLDPLRSALSSAAEADTTAFEIAVAFAREPALRDAYRTPGVDDVSRQLSLRGNEVLRDFLFQQHREAAIAAVKDDRRLARVFACLDDFHGIRPAARQHPLQQPAWMYFPGLETRPWFEAGEFEWAAALADATEAIGGEYRALIDAKAEAEPYMRSEMGLPPTWDHLADRLTWGAFHLVQAGKENADLIEKCPQTMSALEPVPLARASGHAPEVFFSVLQPGVRIPAHVGITNVKLTVHVPLFVPDGCGIRVGQEPRGWQTGSVLVFDDSFEHEAWNGGDQPRVVLITEIWNPGLTEAEIAALQSVIGYVDAWNQRVARAARPDG